jgi:glycosyltransferase involved in cell wall biosynthesis
MSNESLLADRAAISANAVGETSAGNVTATGCSMKGKRICVVNSYLEGRESECQRGLYPRHQLWGTDYLAQHGYAIETLSSLIEDGRWARRMMRWLTSATRLRLGNFDQEFQILRQLRRCDVIYGVTSRDLFLLVWLRSLKLIHAKIVVWVYSPPIRMPRLHELFRPRIFNNGLDGVLCLTQKTAQAYTSVAPRAKVQKVDWGADLHMFQPRGQAGEYFLACGRTQRDYATLLAAAAHISFPLKLVVPRDSFEKVKLPPTVEIVGGPSSAADDRGISYPELIERHLANCRAVLIPLQEDQNTTAGLTNAIEALAVGKPVVMTRTGCLDLDVAGNGCGFYVNPGDVEGWTRAMHMLAQDSCLAVEMGRRGRIRAEEYYNTDRFGRDVCAFFDQICGSQS